MEFRFPGEPALKVRGGCLSGAEDLQCDEAVEPRIARSVDLTHPAGAKRRLDFVGSKPLTEEQPHRPGQRPNCPSDGRRLQVSSIAFAAAPRRVLAGTLRAPGLRFRNRAFMNSSGMCRIPI